jgi:hypothetical protein
MYDRDDSAPALLSFLVGGIVGASLTCLLAPQTGTALRRRIGQGLRTRAAGSEAEPAPALRARKVPEPGLPTDMGRGGRG